MRSFPQFAEFRSRVDAIDRELDGLLTVEAMHPGYDPVEPWWLARLPLRASGYFREYMQLAWGHVAEDPSA